MLVAEKSRLTGEELQKKFEMFFRSYDILGRKPTTLVVG